MVLFTEVTSFIDPKEIENSSNEQFKRLSDLSEKLPFISQNRNDPCLCGSGKKHKKCCLGKDRIFSSSEVHLESFQIKMDALTSEESKNNFSALSEEDKELMSVLYQDLHEHPETIVSENCDYFRQLNVLRIKYPNNPVILNYIGSGYQELRWQNKVEKLVVETYEKFPNYLFAQTAMANVYLRGGFTEKALEVLKGAYTLKQLYPHRTVFHISEFKAFESFMVVYFCMTKDFKQAEVHLQLMEKVLEDDDLILKSAQKVLKKKKRFYRIKMGILRFFGLAEKK